MKIRSRIHHSSQGFLPLPPYFLSFFFLWQRIRIYARASGKKKRPLAGKRVDQRSGMVAPCRRVNNLSFYLLELFQGKEKETKGRAPKKIGFQPAIKKRPNRSTRKRNHNVWMLRLFRSLSRFETQDIKTQPQFNHYLSFRSLSWG